MVEAHTVLEIADGVLHLGVAAVIGFQFQGVALSIGDEGVIAVGGKEGELGAGVGLTLLTIRRAGVASASC